MWSVLYVSWWIIWGGALQFRWPTNFTVCISSQFFSFLLTFIPSWARFFSNVFRLQCDENFKIYRSLSNTACKRLNLQAGLNAWSRRIQRAKLGGGQKRPGDITVCITWSSIKTTKTDITKTPLIGQTTMYYQIKILKPLSLILIYVIVLIISGSSVHMNLTHCIPARRNILFFPLKTTNSKYRSYMS